MIKLSRIVLVNWYTFSTQDIDVRGSIGIFGPNGAGKSSILDAIQVVLTGNNSNHLSLNASSNQGPGRGKVTERRSVREYCLGQIQGEVLRPESITYIALVFERESDGQCWTVGMGFSAKEQDQSEEILCAFIAPGQSLRAGDFLSEIDGQRYPLLHEELLVKLKREPGFQNFGSRPANFTKFILGELRARSGFAAEPKRFLTSIKNALRFTQMDSANHFVRNFLLDDDKIDIETLRDSVAIWRGFQEKIEALEAQKAQVDEAIAEYRELLEQIEQEQRMRWVERKAEADRLEERLASILREKEAKEAERERLVRVLERTRKRIENLKDEINRIEHTQANGDTGLAISEQRIRLESAQTRRRETMDRRDRYLAVLGDVAAILSEIVPVYADDEYVRARGACEAIVSRMNSQSKVAPRDIDSMVQAAQPPLVEYRRVLEEAHGRLSGDRSIVTADLNVAREQLRALNAGKGLLGRETQSLISQLEARGIEAVPLCTLVEVIDEDWREAAETLLGPAREALIVEPELARDAIAFMRSQRRDFFGCQIVNTTKTDDFTRVAAPDSLAAILSTENRHARSFINRRLNAVIRVSAESELLRVNRGVTMDCISSSGGSIEKRKPASRQFLGEEIAARNIPLIESQISQLEQRLDGILRDQKRHQDLVKKIAAFLEGIAVDENLSTLESLVDEANERCLSIEDTIRSLEADQPAEIREKLEGLKSDLEVINAESDEDDAEVRGADRALGKLDSDLDAAMQSAREAANGFAAADQIDPQMRELFLRDFRYLLQEQGSLAGARNAARELASAAGRRAQHLSGSAPRLAEGYGRDFEVAGWKREFSLKHQEALEWLEESRAVVENHHLTQYRDKVELARSAMEESLRSDLLLKLHSRIESARAQIRDLNYQIRSKVFHRERYEFDVKPNPALQDIMRVARRIYENPSDVTTLFQPDADLEGDVARGVAKIRTMLEGGDDVSEISDYRNYLQFELLTRRVEDDEVVSDYSQRQAKGSGGEKQVPFYIAISCAVANTCHNRETKRQNLGLGIVMFDEAFNKLDGPNTGACLSLMNEFNLQSLICAPTEKQATFMEHMDTIVSVNRIGTHCQIDVEYPTGYGRQMFRSANPANIPIEQFLPDNKGLISDAAE